MDPFRAALAAVDLGQAQNLPRTQPNQEVITKASIWREAPEWLSKPMKDQYYGLIGKEPKYPKNECLEAMLWDESLDELIRDGALGQDWWYQAPTLRRIQDAVDKGQYESWIQKDPLCSRYTPGGVLMDFIDRRFWELDLANLIGSPNKKTCPICQQVFLESSVHLAVASRLRYRANPFCGACSAPIRYRGSIRSKDGWLDYARELHSKLGALPPRDFGMELACFAGMPWDNIADVLIFLRCGDPRPESVNAVHGSWFALLHAAGLLPDGILKTSRGYKCLADDGHTCFSLGERAIDNFLFDLGVEHEREPRYPFGRQRADFKVGDTLIEYAGLTGEKGYDGKLVEKVSKARGLGIKVLVLYPPDLSTSHSMAAALKSVLNG